MAGRKIESHQRKPCPNEPSSPAEKGLLELVWENGQIVMKGQPSNVSKGHDSTLKGSSSKPQDVVIMDNSTDHGRPSSNADLSNFSHFSRPAILKASSLCDGKIGSSDKFSSRLEIAECVASSTGFGNGADDRVSYVGTKRKCPNVDESECQSDDVETETVGAKKPTNGSKRRRKAEVDPPTMCKKRRRDAMKEKMRALREVIPNCDKADKASLLDEAIEYLKTLQLQVQIMSSMGAGLCMPPPMYPHFPPPLAGMGVGYGVNNTMMHGGGFPLQQPHFMPFFMAGEPRIRAPCSNIAGCSNPGQVVPDVVLPMGPHHAITTSLTNMNAAAVMDENQQSMFDSEVFSSTSE